jgi:hypothetical protein
MPDLAEHVLARACVSTGRELLIQQVQGGYCDKSCSNRFHGGPAKTPRDAQSSTRSNTRTHCGPFARPAL